MTVSIDATAKKYHGRKAETYEAVRTKQRRWDEENEAVRRFLNQLRPRSVLDVPVGTGRYLDLYRVLKVTRVIGVDVSQEMLDQAAVKAKRVARLGGPIIVLKRKDIRDLTLDNVDVSVCVRFLDLIDERAMRQVMKKLMATSRRAIVCTIRLGDSYVPKSNTATHDERKFRRLLEKHGWKVAKDVPIFTQGWHVFLLKRRST